ncbi:MAG TPA: patatin-like phospholipase family protein [Aquihabitans sp.]|jgi:NTE family protein|nr:patatin-like phospholipase family protein [Aquihabitans sp.]
MTKVGLVLGAGGIVGQAYHAGVLAALEQDLGWDPRTADVIVGTSAGSLTGAALSVGVPAMDLAAWSVQVEPSDEGRPFFEALGADGVELPPFDPRRMLRPWRLPSPQLLARVARRPWAFRPSVAALTLLPPGWVDLSEHADAVIPLLGEEWPGHLRICAARADSGARVVFGRAGAPEATLDRAVAASCAIPGYFQPVEIGGVDYFDGGVHSPTNADVLREEHLDLVIVSSPMSAAHGRAMTPDASFRWANHRRLERECKRLRAAGTEVVRFEPTASVLRAMGMNAMADDRSDRVTRAAFFEVGARAIEDPVAARLAMVASRPSRAAVVDAA